MNDEGSGCRSQVLERSTEKCFYNEKFDQDLYSRKQYVCICAFDQELSSRGVEQWEREKGVFKIANFGIDVLSAHGIMVDEKAHMRSDPTGENILSAMIKEWQKSKAIRG